MNFLADSMLMYLTFTYKKASVLFSVMEQLTNCWNDGSVAKREVWFKPPEITTYAQRCYVCRLATTEAATSHAASAIADGRMCTAPEITQAGCKDAFLFPLAFPWFNHLLLNIVNSTTLTLLLLLKNSVWESESWVILSALHLIPIMVQGREGLQFLFLSPICALFLLYIHSISSKFTEESWLFILLVCK